MDPFALPKVPISEESTNRFREKSKKTEGT